MKNGLYINHYNDKYWYKNNVLHREDGPAEEYSNGDKYWYFNGKRHREDGPAVEHSNGYKECYINGKQMPSQEEFERLIRLKAFW